MAKKRYTKEERLALLDKFYADRQNKKLEDELIRAYMFLIKATAAKYARNDKISYYDDFIQLGSMGFVKSLSNYREGSEAAFETYAIHCITGEIRHYIRDNISMIKIPPAYFTILNHINTIYLEFIREYNREPGIEDIIGLLSSDNNIDMDHEELKKLYDMYFVGSLNDKINEGDGNESELMDLISEENYKSFQLPLDDRLALKDALYTLDKTFPTFASVIKFTFYYDLTQAEIAKKLGISQMEVSRSLKKGLTELWKILNKKII